MVSKDAAATKANKDVVTEGTRDLGVGIFPSTNMAVYESPLQGGQFGNVEPAHGRLGMIFSRTYVFVHNGIWESWRAAVRAQGVAGSAYPYVRMIALLWSLRRYAIKAMAAG